MPIPLAFDVDRAMADVHWLVQELGPRPHGSAEEQAASAGVSERLRAAGWDPAAVGTPPTVIACRGAARRLFLAHLDTVPGSPGAIDNGAGVATLLELARTTAATDLCLGFPVGEEVGLVGSRTLASDPGSWTSDGELPSLVVSLDLTGQGELGMMGLGAAWSDAHLAWLTHNVHPLPATLWAASVYSRLLPHAERSDHRPFLIRGVPSLLLFGRGDGGIFDRYHQPTDTEAEPRAIAETAGALEALATAPPLPAAGPSGPLPTGFIFLGTHVPGGVLTALIGLGLAAGLRDLRAIKELPAWLLRAALAVGLTCLLGLPLVAFGLFTPTTAEHTAAAVMHIAGTGWWTGAVPASAVGLVVLLAVRRLLGPRSSGPLVSAMMAAPLALLDPVLAFPFALAALVGTAHPFLTLLPMLVLLLPDRMRELTFHGLLDPIGWGVLWLLATPLLGRYRPARAADPPAPEDA